MPATPAVTLTVISSTTLRMDVTAGTDTSHIQFDRSWVDNGGLSNDHEIALASGQSTQQFFAMPTAAGSYTVLTRARMGSNPSSWISRGFTVAPPADPDPSVQSLSVTGTGTISATWTISNSSYMRSSNSMAVYLSGANNTTQHFMGYLGSSARSYTSSLAGDGSALVAGATYTLWVYVYDTDNNSFGASNSTVFSRPRPANFNWDAAKTTGGTYNLTYSEWNGLLDKINEFRAYKGLSQITTFNKTTTSGALSNIVAPSATSFNAAINGINTMAKTIATPSAVSTGDKITADKLNTLRNSLNSITNN